MYTTGRSICQKVQCIATDKGINSNDGPVMPVSQPSWSYSNLVSAESRSLGPRKMRVPYSDRSVCASVRLERNGYVHFALPIGATSPNLHQLFILTRSTDTCTTW